MKGEGFGCRLGIATYNMIEQWSALSLLIFISIIIILVYSVGLWAGTILKDQIERDKIKAAQRAAEEKKNAKPGRRR